MFAIYNNQYDSCKTLLELGASPNLKNTDYGSNSVIYAANNKDPKYLVLVLKYKGNPNSIETAPTKDGDQARKAALNAAISYDTSSFKKVRLLVEAGANINYSNNGPEVYTNLPLADAIKVQKMDIVLYLLEKGANYNGVIYTRIDGQQVFILEALRQCLIDLDSEQYKYKLKVITFLKKRGLDYSKEPLSDYILNDIKKNPS